jgi:hypothetical protein
MKQETGRTGPAALGAGVRFGLILPGKSGIWPFPECIEALIFGLACQAGASAAVSALNAPKPAGQN